MSAPNCGSSSLAARFRSKSARVTWWPPCKDGMREDGNERAADDEILLDLKVLHPRRLRPPCRDVVARNHSSASTLALMSTFHREFRRP
jgi:hypothetical protein